MKYCTNCGHQLEEKASFCTNCGTSVKKSDNAAKTKETVQNSKEDRPNTTSKSTKVVVGLMAVIALFFVVKEVVTNIDLYRNPLSISRELTKIVGEWHDPASSWLNDPETIITFRERGDVVIGEDKNKTLYIQLLATGKNEYSGLAVLNGKDDGVNVQYLKAEDKLIFRSNLKKRTWYLIKRN
jgi:hypothetical protein